MAVDGRSAVFDEHARTAAPGAHDYGLSCTGVLRTRSRGAL